MITRPRKVSIGYAEFMTPWITHSSPSRQALYGIISSALGALLVAAVLASGHRTENATLGGLLGGLLLVIGAAGLLTTGKQTVTIDPSERRIVVEESQVLGAKSRTIPFGEIEHVSIGYLGKKSNFVSFYYLVLRLQTGEEYPLFAPGRGFEGAWSRDTVDGWRDRVEEYLRA